MERDKSYRGRLDGIGWYVRQGDLKRIVSAFKHVYTFNKEELDRFKALIKNSQSRRISHESPL